jgi:hypothetical protein
MKANIKCWLLLGWFCGYNLLLFAQPNITRVEYYVNTDPGYGLATNIPITPGINLPLVSFNLNISSYPIGLTLVGARSKDANGAWSHDNRWLIAKLPQQTIKPGITRAEYYINTDPGYGNGIPVTISPAGNDGNGSFTIDITNQPIGLTMVGVRSRDANGAWSHDNRWLIAKLPVENLTKPIKKVEYYIDTDPGYGKATAIATSPVTNLPNRQVNVNISGLSAGKHFIFYRSQDAVGAWSHDNVDSFTLAASQPAPVLVVNSVNKSTFCANDSIKIGYDATGIYTAGNAFKVYLSDANGSFSNEVEIATYTATTNGIVEGKLPSHLPDGTGYKLRVKSSSPVITGEASGNMLTIHDRPVAQTITGLSSTNGNETWPYNVPTASSSTWNWIVTNGTKTTGGITNSGNIQWTTGNTGAIKAAQIKVIETNQFGCIGDTSLQVVTIYKLRIGNTPSTTTPCLKDSVSITLNTDGVFYTTPSANQFIAELSNASGVFSTPVAAATITSTAITGISQAAGTIKIGIPANLPNGTNYRIRVRSTNPVFVGDTSSAISIQKPNLGADLAKSKCIGFGYDLRSNFTDATLTYTYLSNGFAVLTRPDSVNTGVYNVIGTNSNGCADTVSVTVSNYPKPNLGADLAKSKCIGFTYSLVGTFTDASLSYTYFNNAFSTVPNPLAVNTGIYYVVGTNANGCADTAMVTLTDYPKPNIGADVALSKCVGFTYNLTTLYSDISLSYSYFTQAFIPVSNPLAAATGIYNIVATNSNGCKDTAVVTISNYTKPAIGQDIVRFKCSGFKYNLINNYADASLSYSFFTQGFGAVPDAAAVDIGVYSVIATNSNGCKDTAFITVSDFTKPNLGNNLFETKCPGFTFNLTTLYNIAGLTYTYFNQNFVSIPNPSAVETGLYNIIGTNTDGCSDTVLVTVTDNSKPAIGADTTVYHTCANETTNLVALYNTTGLTAVWNTGNAVAAPPGTYRLIVTNGTGCTDTAFANIVLETAMWTGTISNDWHTAANWNINKVPTLQTHVIIAAGTPNACAINSADATAASIQIRQGAIFQVGSNRKLLVAKKCTLLPVN